MLKIDDEKVAEETTEESGTTAADTATEAKKPTVTAKKRERKAAAAKARAEAPTSTSSHQLGISEVPKAHAALQKARAADAAKRATSKDAAPQDPEFRSLRTVDELVAAYNDMVPTAIDFGLAAKPVRMFVDVKTGHLACERLHNQIGKTRGKSVAVKPASQTQKESVMAAKAKKTAKKIAGKAKKAVAKKAKGVKANGSDRFSAAPDAKITVSKPNPFRDGSEKHRRYELLRKHSGKTVKTYLENGGLMGTLGRSVGRGETKVG